ncbi:unnamed protein product [Eretmochelys imbricata]
MYQVRLGSSTPQTHLEEIPMYQAQLGPSTPWTHPEEIPMYQVKLGPAQHPPPGVDMHARCRPFPCSADGRDRPHPAPGPAGLARLWLPRALPRQFLPRVRNKTRMSEDEHGGPLGSGVLRGGRGCLGHPK